MCEDLTLASFPLMHCQRLRDGNSGKDTVDEHAQDLVRRFLDYDVVDGVIIVTDDRNFAPIMRGVLDAGKRLIRFTVRGESTLDQIGEVQRLHPSGGNGQALTTDRRWDPSLIIEDLRQLPSMPTEAWGPTLRRIQLRQPLVSRFLRAFIRRLWGRLGQERTMHFPSLASFADDTVRAEDRTDISRDDVWGFCSMLNGIGVIRTVPFTHEDGGERRAYRPNWEHPFCADAIADIRDQPRGHGGRQSAKDRMGRRANQAPPLPARPPKYRCVVCRADGTIFRVAGARTREDAIAAVSSHYRQHGAGPEVISTIAATGTVTRDTPVVELRVTQTAADDQPPDGTTPTCIDNA